MSPEPWSPACSFSRPLCSTPSLHMCGALWPGAPLSQPRQCSLPCSYWLVWLQWCGSYWKTHSPPCSGAPWGPRKGVGSPKTSLASTPTPGSTGAPAMFSCCTRTRSKCCLLFLPEAKLLLYFLELLIVNLRVLREAKYIPLVNEEINLFKSCLGGSCRKAAWAEGTRSGHTCAQPARWPGLHWWGSTS